MTQLLARQKGQGMRSETILSAWHQIPLSHRFSRISVFIHPHEDRKTTTSKILTLKSVFKSWVFSYRSHRIRVHERTLLRKKIPLSNKIGHLWSGHNTNSYFIRIGSYLTDQPFMKDKIYILKTVCNTRSLSRGHNLQKKQNRHLKNILQYFSL